MADNNSLKDFLARNGELQKKHSEAIKAGDFALADRIKENIQKERAIPFDNYINKIKNPTQSPEIQDADDVENPPQIKDTSFKKSQVIESPKKEGDAEEPDAEKPDAETGEEAENAGEQQEQFGEDLDQAAPAAAAATTVGQAEANQQQSQVLGDQITNTPPKEEVAGGKAREAINKGKEASSADGTAAKATGARGAIQGGANTVKEGAKRLADEAIKKAKIALASAAKKVVVTYGWPVIAWVVGIILLILIIFILWSVAFGTNNKVGTNGSTLTQATDPLSDKEWIKKLLLMTGDRQVGTSITLDLLNGVKSNLTSIESEADTSAQAKTTIAEMRTTITELEKLISSTSVETDASKTKRTELGNKLLDQANKLANFLRNNAPPYTGTSRWPLAVSSNLGTTPHGYSPYYGKITNPDRAQHDVTGGFGNKGICDALDLAVTYDSHPDVYPIFGGKIISKRKLTGQIHDVVVIDDGNGYKALYTDIQSDKNVGDTVTTTESFAKISAHSILHIQVSYKDNCIVTTAGEVDQFRNNKAGKPAAYGTYMQAHIQAVFSGFVKI